MAPSIDIDRGNQVVTAERGAVTFLPEPEPREIWCPIISVDDHLIEPPDVFEGRVPAKYRDAAPSVGYDDEGVPYWLIDGERVRFHASDGPVGRPVNEWTVAPAKYEEFRDGVRFPDARVRDMDLNGIWASLCFPSFAWGFAGRRFFEYSDPEVGLASMRAYNDWMLEEWCGSHPDRFVPCQVTWMSDPVVAAAEIRANAERGFKAVSFSENPEGVGFPSIYARHWDPFFAACEETDTIVNLHVGTSGNVTLPSSDSPGDVVTALFPVNGLIASIDWVFAKIPLRFPNLKIALSEAGVSWVPMIIERMTRAYRIRERSTAWGDEELDPVQLLLRNFWFTSIEDPAGFRLLDIIGEDNVMVEVDYPHPDTSWPDTQDLVRFGTEHLPPETVQKVCYGTAAALYRHPEPPAERIELSVVGSRLAKGNDHVAH